MMGFWLLMMARVRRLPGSGKDPSRKQVFYRTESFFSGRGKIHFEQYESGDSTVWVKKNGGMRSGCSDTAWKQGARNERFGAAILR
jgi:hypothetical protein